jgi:hypothetical protein
MAWPGADLICIKSALSVLEFDLPIQGAYTTHLALKKTYKVTLLDLTNIIEQLA